MSRHSQPLLRVCTDRAGIRPVTSDEAIYGLANKEDMILDGLLDYMENTLPARKTGAG